MEEEDDGGVGVASFAVEDFGPGGEGGGAVGHLFVHFGYDREVTGESE